MGDREARIRDEAYRLWVEAGRPAGDETRHWLEAERRVLESDDGDVGGQAKRADPAPVGPKRARGSKAAVSTAADRQEAAAKSLSGAEAEAFAQRRKGGRSAGAAGSGKGEAVEVAPAKSRPKR